MRETHEDALEFPVTEKAACAWFAEKQGSLARLFGPPALRVHYSVMTSKTGGCVTAAQQHCPFRQFADTSVNAT